MAVETNITLTVVVSGSPQQITINAHQKVAQLIRDALRGAGVAHGDIAGWSLRFEGGGAPIPPAERIADAGIAAGVTLFLDPDEGGGGEFSVTMAPVDEPPDPPQLVDRAVSVQKLARQVEDWQKSRAIYEDRGWLLLEAGELHVDIAFSARLPVGPFGDVPFTPLAVRFDFHNYDVWPPSIRVIDPISRRWLGVPRLRAIDFADIDAAGNPSDAFINSHPDTGRVFLCKRGVREYHSHPEHSGDDWLLYRGEGFGTLGQLCEVLWRLTTRTVTGLNFVAQRLAVGENSALQQAVEIRQENVDQLTAQMQAQMPQSIPGGIPPEVQAQLQDFLAQNNG